MVIDTSALVAIMTANRRPIGSSGRLRPIGRSRHPAALSFGDLFSYALAVARGEPLLFVGDDFSQTDVEICQW
jgi:ribonuclease VapC